MSDQPTAPGMPADPAPLTDQDVDVICEAAHPSRPDREALVRAHMKRIVAARVAAERAETARATDRLRDLTTRLGFGDGITEPQADNDIIVWHVEEDRAQLRDLWELRYSCPPDCPENTSERDYGEHCTAHSVYAQRDQARAETARLRAEIEALVADLSVPPWTYLAPGIVRRLRAVLADGQGEGGEGCG